VKQNRTLRRLITVEEAMEKNLRIKKVKTGYACTVPAEGFPEKETSDLAVRYGATKVAKGYRFVATDRASLQTRVFSFIYDSPVPTR
jgi:hypothetical protein